MNNKAFATAMSQIAREAEAKQEQEAHEQERRLFFGRVRKVFAFLLVAALFLVAFHYHVEMQEYVSAKVFTPAKPTVDGGTGKALKTLQLHAVKRDQVLEDIANAGAPAALGGPAPEAALPAQ